MPTPDWKKRDEERKRKAAEKKAETSKLIDEIDKLMKKAINSDAYHAGESDKLNQARSAIFAIRAGYVSRPRS